MENCPNFLRHFDVVNVFNPSMVPKKNGLTLGTCMGDFVLQTSLGNFFHQPSQLKRFSRVLRFKQIDSAGHRYKIQMQHHNQQKLRSHHSAPPSISKTSFGFSPSVWRRREDNAKKNRIGF